MSLGMGSGAPASEMEGQIVHIFDEAGEAEPITPLNTQTSSVAIQMLRSNSDTVYVGSGEELEDTNGFPMAPGAVMTFDIDLSEQAVYGYALTPGDEVRMLATD